MTDPGDREEHQQREDLRGIYLDPPHILGLPRPDDDDEELSKYGELIAQRWPRVPRTVEIDGRRVHLTHGGGLFADFTGVVGRDQYTSEDRQREETETAVLLTMVICELNLTAQLHCAPVAEAE